jgi:hypothetical protein
MSAEVAHIVLVNQTLRWSSPTQFDDPLDVARVWDMGFPMEELEAALLHEINYIYENEDVSRINYHPLFRYLTEALITRAPKEAINFLREEIPELIRKGTIRTQPHIEELNKQWKNMIPEMRILCFSQRNDIIPVWATYGDNHKGVVMEFHPQEHTDSPWLLAESVAYTNKPMSLASPEEWARSILGIEKIDYGRIFKRYGTVKKENWAFQEETRVFSFKRPNETGAVSDYPFAPNDLKAIYFGYQVTEGTVDTITGFLKYDLSHVKAFMGIVGNNGNGLSFEEIGSNK